MARAMWKGELTLGDESLPLKLYAAAQDRRVHFRLLHEPDGVPVRQRSVHPSTGEVVDREDVRWGYEVEPGVLVVLDEDDLGGLEPEPSREIELLGFLHPRAVPEPHHERPYFLGPDGDEETYLAFAQALLASGRVALVRWVMRKKRYAGVISAGEGSLGLTTLRTTEEVVLLAGFHAPGGRALGPQEKALAEQLVSALSGHFDPAEYEEQYRRRVEELVRAKAAGKKPRLRRAKPKKPAASLAKALRQSLSAAKEKRVA